jgi:hypothetical protein
VNPATGEPVLANGNPVPLIGPQGPLPPGTFVTLAAQSLLAQGIGVPTTLGGSGQPLPDEVILDAGEVATIRDHVDQDNQAIRDICGQAGISILDVHSIFNDVAAHGRVVGGVTLSANFLTGGIFSYDGVHPSALGYAVVANDWIQAVNSIGGNLPELDLSPFMGVTSASAKSVKSALPAAEFTPEAYAGLLAAFPRLDQR